MMCWQCKAAFPIRCTGYLHDGLSLRALYSAADAMVIPFPRGRGAVLGGVRALLSPENGVNPVRMSRLHTPSTICALMKKRA